ncbi:uncharacterized protein LOC131840922 [Achroia grisella]|uniref:uncharacterized protein LOC131840922 n=1 Tax=Achroia grisella TaxID=688607 RepID=UPI0027D29DB5|nr:uncharacterized protein LOC131840922 [Achroia grisella]
MEVHTCFAILILTTILFNEVQLLNILGVFPFEGKSHSFVFNPYMLELAKRGHNVTVISHFPQKMPVQNYHDISLAGKSKVLMDVFSLHRSYWSIIGISLFLVKSGTDNCKLVMADENVQLLWKNQAKFDLVVVEQFNSDCYLGLAHKLKAPVIGITSHKIMPWHMSRFGIVYNPSHTAFSFLEGGTKPTLYQRFERVIFHNYFNILYKYFCQKIDEKTLAQYFDDIPPLEDLARDIKLMLVYQNFAMMGSHIFPSNVIEIGGLHVDKPQALPEDLRKFIKESDQGVIYISFGSMLKATTMPTDKLKAIIDALSELPQRVIWKWEDKTPLGGAKNIYLSKWMPQNDILAHPNVIAFFSHCGLLSTTEAIHHGVPMVAMPIFGDQPANAAAVEESGLGQQIQINELTKDKLLAKLRMVLDPKFRENVKHLSKIWHDRPMSAMDTAIFWTEFAARNRNLTLRAAAANVPYYQYWCLDVLIVFIVLILVFVLFTKYLVSLFKKINKKEALKILGVFPHLGKSHFFVFQPYLLELANRGHEVTVISHFPQKLPINNYKDINLAGEINVFEDSFPIERSYWTIIQITLMAVHYGRTDCKTMLSNENVQNLWKTNTKFDLVVTEQFNSDCSLGLAYKLKTPVVGITSHKIMPWHMSRFGIGYNPSYIPFMFLEGGTKPTLYQRVERTIFYYYSKILYKFFSQRMDESTLAQYFDDMPPLEELGRDVKLLLVYQNFAMMSSEMFPTNIIEIGGLHVAKPKPLPEDIRKFIEDSENGVIYISFGSLLRATSTPNEKIEAIIGALSQLPQRVIWKWEENDLPDANSKNIFFSKWLPQNDILGHSNVLAFYSHCGLLGTTEAIHHGVPMVGMPIFGDQPVNAAAIEESGLGVQIEFNELTAETLLEKFRIVLDPKFRENVKELSKVWHDRPLSPMDTAIFWTEYAARNGNFTFRAASANVPFYQYLCLDIIGVVIGILIVSIYFVKLNFCLPFSITALATMKVIFIALAFLLIVQIFTTSAYNILAIFPYQGKSHFIVFKTYLQELARRGHNVTVISYFPETQPLSNYHDINLDQNIEAIENSMPVVDRSYLYLFGISYFLTNMGVLNCETMLANEQVQRLIKEKAKFDVAVLEQFNSDCGLGIAYKLNVPVVGVTSHVLMPWHYQRFGIPFNPSYVPFHFTEGGTRTSLLQRVEVAFFDLWFRLIYKFYAQRNNQIALSKYFDDIPPLEDLAREIKYLLLGHHFVLTGSRLFPSNVIEVGGYHVPKAKPLPQDLKRFVEEAEHGVIYINFGSVVKSSSMTEEQIKVITSAMAELPQRFIWKWESNAVLAHKNKLYVSKWLPQVDILAHPKTLAFYSHAGMGGTTEALHYGVPMVAMPILGDQPSNGASIEESGLGVQLHVRDLTKENLLAAFRRVLDPKFHKNVKDLSRAWHDRPMSPLDTAVYWTEYAARNSKFTFRTAAADVPLYQYLNLDIAFVFLIVFAVLIVKVTLIRSICCSKKKSVVEKKKAKRN